MKEKEKIKMATKTEPEEIHSDELEHMGKGDED